MTPIERRNAGNDAFAEAVFLALESLDSIAPLDFGKAAASENDDTADSAPAGTEGTRIGFDDLYRFANDPAMPMDAGLAQALAASSRMRADLRLLIQRASGGRALMAAAASSGTVTTRHGTSFRMTLRESRADRNQVYVLIHINGKAALAPRALFVIDDGAACRKVPLPAPLNGTVQLLLDADSDIVAALRDPAAEVFVQ